MLNYMFYRSNPHRRWDALVVFLVYGILFAATLRAGTDGFAAWNAGVMLMIAAPLLFLWYRSFLVVEAIVCSDPPVDLFGVDLSTIRPTIKSLKRKAIGVVTLCQIDMIFSMFLHRLDIVEFSAGWAALAFFLLSIYSPNRILEAFSYEYVRVHHKLPPFDLQKLSEGAHSLLFEKVLTKQKRIFDSETKFFFLMNVVMLVLAEYCYHFVGDWK